MRAIWKGHIRFSLVTIPIEVFNAVSSQNLIKFRQLHRKDHGPVGYQKMCKECGDKLSKDMIVKGFEYEPDQYALIEQEDLNNIKLKSSKIIDIEAFIKAEEVHPLHFENAYYVAPAGEIGKKVYALLRSTLMKTKKAAVGRIILRDREDVVMIAPYDKGLVMYKLRFPYEVKDVKKVPDLEVVEADKDQLALAETLVDSMSKKFSEVDFEDRFKDAMMELIEKKIQGKQTATVDEDEVEKPVVDIMSALKASIEQAKKKSA